MLGRDELERIFDRKFSSRFNIHRTRKGFPVPDGIDTFEAMARNGIRIIDQVVSEEMGGTVSEEDDTWLIPR